MIKKIKGFTLAEFVLVMIIIAFLWMCVAKVINKNMDNKVKVYMYNIYNEMQHAAQIVNKTLSSEINNKNINDILLETNAITYCDAFSKNTNTYNEIDCIQGTSQFMILKDVKPNIENRYNCTRTYKYNVNKNGNVVESYIPSTATNYINNIASQSNKYQNLINNNAKTGNKYYNCIKTTVEIPKNSEGEAGEFKLNQRFINQAFVSSNNVSFYFITTSNVVDNSYTEKNIYNYSANVYQDAICDVASTGSSETDDTYKNLFIYEPYTNAKKIYGKDITSVKFGSATSSDVGIFKAQKGVKSCGISWKTIQGKIPDLHQSDKCKTFFNFYTKYGDKQCCVFAFDNKGDSIGGYKNIGCWEAICQGTIPCVKMPSVSNDPNATTSSSFYNKWNNYFKKYASNNKFYKQSVSFTNVNEGTKTTTTEYEGISSLVYPNHFIYVAIDNAFKYGTYGKDVFAFEHFESKIIPVGILAHDRNSPLKFNVITRDKRTKNIERLNEEALTFCEAMKYTGEKFSQYCECKNDSENIVTQYTNNIHPKCLSDFGCVITPVKPNIMRFK